jgi:hypothetical protein
MFTKSAPLHPGLLVLSSSGNLYFSMVQILGVLTGGRSQTLIDLVYEGISRIVEPYKLEYRVRKSDNRGLEYFWAYDPLGAGEVEHLGFDNISAKKFNRLRTPTRTSRRGSRSSSSREIDHTRQRLVFDQSARQRSTSYVSGACGFYCWQMAFSSWSLNLLPGKSPFAIPPLQSEALN